MIFSAIPMIFRGMEVRIFPSRNTARAHPLVRLVRVDEGMRRGPASAAPWLALVLVRASAAEQTEQDIWPDQPPGRPSNLTVLAMPGEVEVKWVHGAPSSGGLATNYALKWQEQDATEVQWWAYALLVGEEKVRLQGLAPDTSYALRVGAVNKHGRAWSELVVFTTLSTLRCSTAWHWSRLYDKRELLALCGKVGRRRSRPRPIPPRRTPSRPVAPHPTPTHPTPTHLHPRWASTTPTTPTRGAARWGRTSTQWRGSPRGA